MIIFFKTKCLKIYSLQELNWGQKTKEIKMTLQIKITRVLYGNQKDRPSEEK